MYLSLTTAPVTKHRESPLAVAARKRNLDMIKCLVKECNATVNGESLLLMVSMLLTADVCTVGVIGALECPGTNLVQMCLCFINSCPALCYSTVCPSKHVLHFNALVIIALYNCV